MEQRQRFAHTLFGRLVLFGLVPTMLLIGVRVTMNAIEGYRTALASKEELLESEAAGAAAELGGFNERWNATAVTIAAAQHHGLFGRRRETVDFLNETNAISAFNLNMYVVYEPNADGKDAESLKAADTPREAIDAAGRFLAVVEDEYVAGVRSGRAVIKTSTGMDALPYYQTPKALFSKSGSRDVVLTEPYMRGDQLVISHVVPLVVQDRFAGVAGVDRSLRIVTQIASSIKERTGADVFVLSPERVFIAATTDLDTNAELSLKNRTLESTPFAPMAERWRAAAGAATLGSFHAPDPVLGVECLYARAVVPVGGWSIILRRPMSEVMKSASDSLVNNVILGVVGMALIAGLTGFVAHQVSRRVRAAAVAADRIARGDLTVAIQANTGRDESGQLMRSMASMDANLNCLVGDVKQAGIRLHSTATEIAATSRQQEAASATFGAASSQIAAAVKEISASGRDLVKTMESVNRMAVETADLAGSGQSGLRGIEQVMRELDGATAGIADKLNAINERSQKITAVVTAITKVADQTNILSINTAIEAEKAGEYGAGFLVIAREIRRLADQTASATLDIEQMVQQMQGAVSSGVMEMDRFSDQVRRAVREVATTGGQFTGIIERVNLSADSFRQVNESMQAQNQGAQQISEAMGSLVDNANRTMQSVGEFAQSAADLQSAIGLLREAVSRFRLRD